MGREGSRRSPGSLAGVLDAWGLPTPWDHGRIEVHLGHGESAVLLGQPEERRLQKLHLALRGRIWAEGKEQSVI